MLKEKEDDIDEHWYDSAYFWYECNDNLIHCITGMFLVVLIAGLLIWAVATSSSKYQ